MSVPDEFRFYKISDDIKLLLKKFYMYREVLEDVTKEHIKLRDANSTLNNIVKVAQDNDKQQTAFRMHAANIILQQKRIITNFVNVKEENLKLKEELKSVNEMLQNTYEEINKLNLKSEEKLKNLQDTHDEAILQLLEKYRKKEQDREEEIIENKKKFENIITELKKTIDSLQTEKNIVIGVTVREYEDQLNTMRTALEESKAEKKSLEERNIANMNVYTKRLEFQEQNYISMLEKVRKDMLSENVHKNSHKHIKQNQQYKSENISSFPVTAAQPICGNFRSRVQNSMCTDQFEAHNETYNKNDLPVNISYYNQLQIQLPQSGQGASSSHSYFTDVTSSSRKGVSGDSKSKSNDMKDVYNYLKSRASSNTVLSDLDYEGTENQNNNCDNSSTNPNKQNNAISVVQKKRKLFNPQDEDDRIQLN